jgi:hypothetical protein
LADQTDLNSALGGKSDTGHDHSGTYEPADVNIQDAVTKRHAHANQTALDNVSGTNTGDQDISGKSDVGHNHDSAYEPINANIQTHIGTAHAPADAQKNSNILKTEIEAVLVGEISSHTHAGGSGESEIIVLKTGDTANNTANLADCTGLTFVATANKTYLIEVFLVWSANATTVGIKASLSASAAVTILAGSFITNAAAGTPDSSAFNASNVVTTTSASAFTTGNMGTISAVLVNSSSSNTITVRFAAETTGTITAKAGSVLRYRLLN